MRALKDEWSRKHALPHSDEQLDELQRESMRRVEAWLDQGMGSCILTDARLSSKVVEAMQNGDGDSHELGCYVVMPNHVHAIVRPLSPVDDPLEAILQRWKGGSSYEINLCVQRFGALWERESFDRMIRDEEHLYRVIQYIGRNPRNASMSEATVPLWIRPSWVAAGWKFERSGASGGVPASRVN